MGRAGDRVACWLLVFASGCGARTELGNGHVAQLDATSDDKDASADAPVDATEDTPVTTDAPPPLPACTVQTQTLLATTTYWMSAEIVLAGPFLYFRDQNGISRVPKTGGPVSLVTAPSTNLNWNGWAAYAIDATYATWINTDNGNYSTVGAAPIGGGPSTIVASLPPFYTGVISTPSGLLVWQGYTCPGPECHLDRITGGVATTLTTALPLATTQLVADGNVVYGASGDAGVFAFDPPNITPLGTVGAVTLAIDATTIFFAQNQPSSKVEQWISVWRVEKTGGPATALTTAATGTLGGLAVDDAHVYFTKCTPSPGTVERIGKHGEDRTVIASDPKMQPLAVALDDTCVYWIEFDQFDQHPSGGHIYAAPK